MKSDHTLIALLLASGRLRWELFSGSDQSGELCFNGLRFCTELDKYGVPRMTRHLRTMIESWEAAREGR